MDFLKCLKCLLLFMDFLFSVSCQRCPFGWQDRSLSDTCYKFQFRSKKSWFDAQSACLGQDGYLLKVETQEEKTWILSQMALIKQTYPGNYEWWTGLNNRENLTVWAWADGNRADMSLVRWGQGEPNNYLDSERCAEIWDSLYNDKNCETRLNYVCERRKDKPLKCQADDGWEHVAGMCYKYLSTERTFDQAKTTCALYDGSMVQVSDPNTQQTLTDMAVAHTSAIWIGLYATNTSSGLVWKWTDDTDLTDAAWWNTGLPTGNSSTNDTDGVCAVLNSTTPDGALQNWQSVSCGSRYPFICQKNTGSCSAGWLQHQGICTLFYTQRQLDWRESVGFCNLRGGTLLEIKSQSDKMFITKLMQERFSGSYDSFWLGLSGADGNWTWNTGATVGISDPNWAWAPQPTTDRRKECAFVTADDMDGKWKVAADCSKERGVVCTASVDTPVTEPSDITSSYVCEDGWINYGNQCYKEFEKKVTWAKARSGCQGVGGDLAVIKEEEVETLLSGTISSEVWIGLNDRQQEGKYVWLQETDQATLTYWKDRQPNQQVIGRIYSPNCVAMMYDLGTANHGKWAVYSCVFHLGYICQKQGRRNIAPGKLATQSSVYQNHVASLAIGDCTNSDFSQGCCSLTNKDLTPWWQLDLGTEYNIKKVVIHRRWDSCTVCKSRLHDMRLFISKEKGSTDGSDMVFQDHRQEPPAVISKELSEPRLGRYVRIDIPDRREFLTLCEVQVFEVEPAVTKSSSSAAVSGSWEESPSTGHSYQFFTYELSWADAKDACETIGGGLVNEPGKTEMRYLKAIFNRKNKTKLWLAASVAGNDTESQTWDGQCSSFSSSVGEAGNITSTSCTERLAYACKKEAALQPQQTYKNVAQGKSAEQSSIYESYSASYAVDGCKEQLWSSGCCSHTEKDRNPFWEVDLGAVYSINKVVIYRRYGDCQMCKRRLSKVRIFVSQTQGTSSEADMILQDKSSQPPSIITKVLDNDRLGRYVRIDIPGRREYLTLCEVEVYGIPYRETCPSSDWTENTDLKTCYKFHSTAKTWQDARDVCSEDSGQLVVVSSPKEQLFIYENVHLFSGDGVWIGVHDTENEGNFRGVNGQELAYTDWADGEPNDLDTGGEDCTSISLYPNSLGRWNDKACSSQFSFVCHYVEAPLTTSATTIASTAAPTALANVCSTGWVRDDVSGYCYFIGKNIMNWYDARDDCRERAAELTSINSKHEQDFLPTILPESIIPVTGYWTGGHDMNTEHKWEWLDNTDWFADIKWKPGNPDNYNNEDCGMIVTYSLDVTGMFNDGSCYSSYPYICKKTGYSTGSPPPPSTAAPAQTTTEAACEADWTPGPNGCYQFSSNRVTNDDARAICQRQGGQLASILSQEEQIFIAVSLKTLIGSSFYIGLTDTDVEGTWTWTDGSPLSYTNWMPDEPNDYGSGEDCGTAVKASGMWNDVPCDMERGYVCKRKSGLSVSTTTTTVAFTTVAELGTTTTTALTTTVPHVDCYVNSKTYQGDLSYTLSGKTCQPWLSNTPHKHKQKSGYQFPEGNVADASNYCRDPNSENAPWCYTMDPAVRWELCPIARCSGSGDTGGFTLPAESLPDNDESCWTVASEWAGNMSYTISGRTCQRWTLDSPHRHTRKDATKFPDESLVAAQNFCRDPDGEGSPWCYTTDPTVRWEFCPIPRCKAPFSEKCGPFWTSYSDTDSCYMFVDDQLTWQEARSRCVENDGDLLSISTMKEQFYITGRSHSMVSNEVWIGLSNSSPRKGWHWTDGSPFAAINWAPGEPNNREDNEYCGALVRGGESASRWIDLACDVQRGFICEKPGKIIVDKGDNNLTTTTIATTLPAQSYYGCGVDWVGYQQWCYLFVQKKSSWYDAMHYCRKEMGDLASITSQPENDFVLSQMPKSYCFNTWVNDTQCEIWAEKGECDRNPVWMATHCHSACKLCIENCSDIYNPLQCTTWADQGECDSNPTWMLVNCAESCGICFGASSSKSGNAGSFWLGFNDVHKTKQYTWSDNTRVTYTNWKKGEPDAFYDTEPDCVAMYRKDGLWMDAHCDYVLPGFICKQQKTILPVTSASPFASGCSQDDSFGYGSFCYTFIRDKMTWDDASKYCTDNVGNLAVINDRFTQAFIASELVNRLLDYWIGLTNRNTSGSYVWVNGQVVRYTHWWRNHTGNEANICVTMSTIRPVGLWNTVECKQRLPFICQSLREGYTTSVPTTVVTTALPVCPDGWREYNQFCYKVFGENSKKTWFNARLACLGLSADLTSVHSEDEQDFLRRLTVLSGFGNYWIGFNDIDTESGYVWSDGSPVEYSKWLPKEPNDAFTREDCTAYFVQRNGWNDDNCHMAYNYICKLPRGKTISTTAAPPPTTPEAFCGSDSQWLLRNGKCYYVSPATGVTKTWYAARSFCMKNGGDLVSIHNVDVSNLILSMTSVASTSTWVGLNKLNSDNSFRWSDGTPLDYVSWDGGEPDDNYGTEKCVVANFWNGNWMDTNCNTKNRFICQRDNGTGTVSPLVPTTTPTITGGCPSGLKPFGNNCYKVSGTSTADKMFWAQAESECQTLGPSYGLATIHSSVEQAFLVSLVLGKEESVWIGLNDLNEDDTYDWKDNSEMTYSNWDEGEPGLGDLFTKELCVEMLTDKMRAGKWNNVACSARRAYICKGLKSPDLTTPRQPLNGCHTEYRHYGSSCFKLVRRAQMWNESLISCESDEGSLASVDDIYEQSFIEVMLKDVDVAVWIGLADIKVKGFYEWTNGFPMRYTKWAVEEPSRNAGEGCVVIKDGYWNDTTCTQKLPYLCKISLLSAMTTPSPNKVCRDRTWHQLGSYCYYINLEDRMQWAQALDRCRSMNMELVSIHKVEENTAIVRIILGMIQGSAGAGVPGLWIGLGENSQLSQMFRRLFFWVDGTPLNYVNWAANEPSRSSENCVELSPYSGQWNDLPCSEVRGFVCKTKADVTTVTSSVASTSVMTPIVQPLKHPKQQTVSKDKSLTVGQIIGIVIGILGALIIGGVAVYVYRRLQSKNDLGFGSHGFENALYHKSKDTISIENSDTT